MITSLKDKITLSGNEIYYEVIGDGIPIVIIHGWGVNHRIMSGCMEPIFQSGKYSFKRIYFDLPGMGESKANQVIKTSDDVLDIILAFIDTIIPKQSFLLAGESYGGYLSRGLLKRRADDILGLMLLCPLIYPGYRKGNVPALSVLEKDEAFLDSLAEEVKVVFQEMTIRQTRPVWENYYKDILETIHYGDKEFLSRLDGAFTYDISLKDPFLKPSLFIMGRQDTEVGYLDQFQLMDDYPRASYFVLDKAGHNLQIEQDGLFRHLVCEWFDRVLSFNEEQAVLK